jgi:hypothetical protein
MNKKYLIIAGLVLIGVGFSLTAKANALFFLPTVQTATATTTAAFIGVGTGTTTLSFDAYANGATRAANYATLFTQFAASSTSSLLTITPQYSQDGVDWYSDSTLIATSSVTAIQTANTYTWLAATTATSSRAIVIKTPTRYTRVQYSLTGAAGAVWAQIVPAREVIQ